jgi:ABC-type Mn2+/Zn2+ transport system permease subunit
MLRAARVRVHVRRLVRSSVPAATARFLRRASKVVIKGVCFGMAPSVIGDAVFEHHPVDVGHETAVAAASSFLTQLLVKVLQHYI